MATTLLTHGHFKDFDSLSPMLGPAEVKPQKDDAHCIETETLCRQAKATKSAVFCERRAGEKTWLGDERIFSDILVVWWVECMCPSILTCHVWANFNVGGLRLELLRSPKMLKLGMMQIRDPCWYVMRDAHLF